MATETKDTRFSELKARAERVIREYRDHDELVVKGAADGMLVSLRSALDDLETALDVATDTAEVLASQHNETTAEPDERPEITVLVGDHCDAIYGLHGITQALVALDEPASIELAIAARALAKRLYGGLGSLLSDVEARIEQASGMTVRS